MKEAASRARRAMGFASGMLLGFIAAFVVFDFAFLRGGTGWQLFHRA
jgi:hypothetical protein